MSRGAGGSPTTHYSLLTTYPLLPMTSTLLYLRPLGLCWGEDARQAVAAGSAGRIAGTRHRLHGNRNHRARCRPRCPQPADLSRSCRLERSGGRRRPAPALPRRARPRRACHGPQPGHGNHQRHAGQLLRRRPAMPTPPSPSSMGGGSRPRGRSSSMSAASSTRPGSEPVRARRGAAGAPLPVVAALAAAGYRVSGRFAQRRHPRRARQRPAPQCSMTSRR